MTINLKLLTSWKTSLAGVAVAALGFVQAYMIHNWSQIFRDPTTLFMFVVAVGLAVAKDFNATGAALRGGNA